MSPATVLSSSSVAEVYLTACNKSLLNWQVDRKRQSSFFRRLRVDQIAATDRWRCLRNWALNQVVKIDLADLAQAKIQITKATGIWFSGGDQSRLMTALRGAGMTELIQQRHRAGVPIGGTSAGAAVMSKEMIIDAPKVAGLLAGNTPMGTGLGLAPEMIVDQHFVKRGRMSRLLSAVLDHEDLLGVGIDEADSGPRSRVTV